MKRYRNPPSLIQWVFCAILLGSIAIVVDYVCRGDVRVGQAVAGLFVIATAIAFEAKLERELQLENLKVHWESAKKVALPLGTHTIKTIWSDPDHQKAFRAGSYIDDTDALISGMNSSNIIGLTIAVVYALPVIISAVGDTFPADKPQLDIIRLVGPFLVPLITMWGPAWHLVRRNNDIFK